MAWLAEQAAAGTALGMLAEEARQFARYAGGDCGALDPDKILDEGAKGAALGLLLAPVGWAVGKALGGLFRGLARLAAGSADADAGALGGLCFVAGTPVSTPIGSRPIEELKENDEVLSWDFQSSCVITQTVGVVFARNTTQIVAVTVGRETVEATCSHPFWVQGAGWVPAQELRVGMKLLSTGQSDAEVTGLKLVQQIRPVFNFEVEAAHNYFVGNEPVLVHNATAPHSSYNAARFASFATTEATWSAGLILQIYMMPIWNSEKNLLSVGT